MDTAKEFLQSDHESIANGKKVKEEDETLDSENRGRGIAEWISRLRKPLSSNKDGEAEGKEEEVSSTQASTEEKPPINEYE